MKTRIVAVATAAVLTLMLTGCGDDTTANDDAQPRAFVQSSDTKLATEQPTGPEDAATLTTEDEGFLQYVSDEKPPASILDDYSTEQLISLGHESCDVVRQGTPWEDIRMVDGEQPTSGGYYPDSSAVLNGALYNYCPELIPDPESND